MKVVVAGGSGLIGRHLVPALLARGDEAVVLTRDAKRAAAVLPDACRVVAWDPTDVTGAWVDSIDGAGAVVNLCGESVGRWPWTRARKRSLRQSRLVPTRALVEAIAALPPGRRPQVMLSASGSDRYEGRDAEPASERTPATEGFLADLCEEWEAEARAAERYGTRVVLLRTSLVIARRAPALERLALPIRWFVGGPIGSGRQWVSWIAVEDAVAMMLWALDHPEVSGPVNLAAPDPRRQSEFAACLATALHRPARLRTPAAIVRLVLGEQQTLALGSRRVWPGVALSLGYRFQRPTLEEALARVLP